MGYRSVTHHHKDSETNYVIALCEVGQKFGTRAEVRSGGTVLLTQVFPYGHEASAIEAGKRLADAHAEKRQIVPRGQMSGLAMAVHTSPKVTHNGEKWRVADLARLALQGSADAWRAVERWAAQTGLPQAYEVE